MNKRTSEPKEIDGLMRTRFLKRRMLESWCYYSLETHLCSFNIKETSKIYSQYEKNKHSY